MKKYEFLNLDENLVELEKICEEELIDIYKKIDDICLYNSMKVLNAFWENNLSENSFNSTSGYGYNDIGRETIENIFATIFKAEDALVRSQMVSGSHALSTTLFALLRPGDKLLSIQVFLMILYMK